MRNFIEKAKKIVAPAVPFVLLLPVLTLADTSPLPAPGGGTVTDITGVGSTICIIFNWMFYFLIILAIVFIIVAAFKYLFAAGDPEKVKSAGHSLIYACVAIAVAIIAKAVPSIVGTLLGSGAITTGC